MAAFIVAAVAAIEQISTGQDHHAVFEVEIPALNEGLYQFIGGSIWFDTIVHTMQETPCSLRPRGSAIR